MQIILISQKNRKTFQLSLTRKKLMLTLLASGMLLGLAFFTLGLSKGEGLKNIASTAKVAEELSEQRQELTRLQTKSRNTLDGIALRVGQMQAEITRLNAVGEHLAKKAKLDMSEFDFNVLPAQGSAELYDSVESFGEGQLMADIKQLEKLISVRQQQLEMLDIFSSNKILSKTIRPAGLPVQKGWLSSHFGYRADPFSGKRTFHHGVDIAGKNGSNVVAVASGIVTFAGDKNGYGYLIEIDHGEGYVTRYGHNKEILVKAGDLIKQSDVIAKMGSTGRSTGPHVHFEVLKNGKKINPRKFLYASR
jgi:murein DD-endopeptidase MepM/ murein hydrolase activator NlpD